MKKRLVSLALVFSLACSLLPGALAAGGHPFTDVPADHWANDAVTYVYENELMGGTGGKTFSPNTETTRGMVVTILYRLAGEPAVSGKPPFGDVPANAWYAKAVTWAAGNGIVSGTGANTFSPEKAITREALAVLFYRYAEDRGYDLSPWASLSVYDDADQISSYARPAMIWACGTGLITGVTQERLLPKGTAKRAQVAEMLSRFCQTVIPGGLTDQRQMLQNLQNSSLRKKDTLVAMAQVMLDDGFAPAFVAGVLGNIIEEGACGLFESSAYVTRPELEPDYLVYMDENYDYRNVYSGQYIYKGFSLTEVYAMVLELGPGGANGRGSCFGLGCMQWTSYNRIKRLLENYLAVAGGADTITMAQVQRAEGLTISYELKNTYKSVYTSWQNENPAQEGEDAAFAAGVKVCVKYGIPVGYNTEAVQNKRGSVAAEVYRVMMGQN